MTQSFYWYDFETFGIRPRTDRPAQFAGMRTDMNLDPAPAAGEESGEVFYAKPSEDYLPSPESCLLTGIVPQLCEERGMPQSEFAGRIFERLNVPGTISIGYNTLGFDDEVCRFLFWRNFLDPYAHGWKDGCSRWDLFPLVCAVWALRGDGIRWPKWEELDPERFPQAAVRKGVCMKLECLTEANGITHGQAHDALSDVEATIGLARLIREKEPKLWDWALANRSKEQVRAALEKGPVVWVSPKIGVARGCTMLGGMLYANGNDVLMWDLREDPSVLRTLSREEIIERITTPQSKLPEGVTRLPVRKMKINASPFVCGALGVLSADRAARYGIDRAAAVERYQALLEVRPLVEGILAECMEHGGGLEPVDVDAALYDGGFTSAGDKKRFTEIRRATPEQLAASAPRIVFDDERFTEMLFRFRARSWPETLTADEQDAWRRHCAARLLEGAAGSLTVDRYFEEIDELQAEGDMEDERRQMIFEALYDWGERVGAACS